jgi:hypothetical protein
MDVKFAKINAEKAKFFVKKLNIQVLPAVLCFVDGILKQRFGNFVFFQVKLIVDFYKNLLILLE